jgi:LmbE family N-acetylglucosaminyl deacetylase
MDDEVLGVGGTIAKHVDAGDDVTVCVVCKRAYNHRFNSALMREQKLAAKRAKAILGYRELRCLDLPDERLDERLLDLVVPLEAVFRDVRPDIVYTHHRGDVNQDHRATFQASLIACRAIARPKVRRLLSYEVPSSTDQAPPFPDNAFQPNFYVEIHAFLAQKVKAMQAYRRELREFPHPRSPEGLDILAKKRGMEVGFHAAEAFVIIRDEWR